MILNLFAGPGGWDEALRLLGVGGVVGLETDPHACATATMAGFARHKVDVRAADPTRWAAAVGLIASPPCQTFTDAGKAEGQASLTNLIDALTMVADGATITDAVTACGLDAADPRTALTLEPMRYLQVIRPRWIAFEEVKQVLPVWDAYALILAARFGYHTWTGVLNAADYGLPQLRRRAFLTASLDGPDVYPTPPTHTEHPHLDPHRRRAGWVTMAKALAWGPAECEAANRAAPPPALDPVAALWPLTRPATTVVRSFRPDVIAVPGYRIKGPRQNAPGSVAVTPTEMCTLQGIRTDYPFRAKSPSLIGAVLPPPMGVAVLAPLLTPTSQHTDPTPEEVTV